MTRAETEQVQQSMEALEDYALLRLAAVEYMVYRPEAIEIAGAELQRRGLKVLNKEDFWKQFPSERIFPNGFCASCIADTTEESPGNLVCVEHIGLRLIGTKACPVCHAILQRKWVCVLFPIIPLGRYRVLYLDPGPYFSKYICRKLRGKRSIN